MAKLYGSKILSKNGSTLSKLTLTGLKESGASQVRFESESLLLSFCSSFSSSIRGKPSPTRAQLTNFNFSRSASTTGPAAFSPGNSGAEQLGHLKPAGAGFAGNEPK